MVSYNILSVVLAALRSLHGIRKIEQEVSSYYLADEICGTYRGMMIARQRVARVPRVVATVEGSLPPEDWSDLGTMSLPQFSSLLQDWAQLVNLKAFTSTKRKPKKKKPKLPYDPRHPHVSTARLLAEKKKSRASPNK